MYKKQIFKYLLFLLLIFQNINFINATEIVAEQKETKTVKTTDQISTKEKIKNLFSNLKDSFYSNKSSKEKEEIIKKEIEKTSSFFAVLNILLSIPTMNNDNGYEGIIQKFGNSNEAKTYGFFYAVNIMTTEIIQKGLNATIEEDDKFTIDFIARLQNIISSKLLDKKISRAILSELMDMSVKRISHKLIKSTQEKRIVRRIMRATLDSLIYAISQEILTVSKKADFKNNFIIALLINSMSEIIGENISKVIDKAIEETQTN
ncbi:MAG: hypothetical protein ABIA74_06350 [bacterium]